MIINIIHLPNSPDYPHREQREKTVIEQMEMEGCSYMFWQGIICRERKTGISKAHKQIIVEAKKNNQPFCCIAEDDLRWYGKGAWEFFLNNIPNDFDVYVGSYYSGRHDENFVVKGLRGLTLYIVAQRYYDIFLSLSEKFHIDGAIAMSGAKIIVSPKFVCYQQPGFSEQRGHNVDDNKCHNNKPKYSFDIEPVASRPYRLDLSTKKPK